jgi:hypothetical protein
VTSADAQERFRTFTDRFLFQYGVIITADGVLASACIFAALSRKQIVPHGAFVPEHLPRPLPALLADDGVPMH